MWKIIIGLTMPILFLGFWFNLFSFAQTPSFSLDKVFSTEPKFPSSWSTGEVSVELVDWRMSQEFLGKEHPAAFGADDSVLRIWNNGGEIHATPEITQKTLWYKSSAYAFIRYFLGSPETAYAEQWPNFSSGHTERQIVPKKSLFARPNIERYHVVCGMGSIDDCQLWYYWAHSEHCLILIRFFAPNQGIDSVLFSTMVNDIDVQTKNCAITEDENAVDSQSKVLNGELFSNM